MFAVDFSWAIPLIMVPLAAGMVCFMWPRTAGLVGLMTAVLMVIATAGLAWQLRLDGVYRHTIGGWGAPLGIDLYVDGLSLMMLALTAVVGLGVSVYAQSYFEPKQARHFWPLWMFLLASLNAMFISADIFNLYITLELMGLSAVALAALTGSRDALVGAMRYLLTSLLASLAYLLGVALLYHSYATVDIALLAERVQAAPAVMAALGLIVAGLVMKTALFPLHFWLPPAHASAPVPVSALLSALVVKGSFYILLRLWLSVFDSLAMGVEQWLGVLGGLAVLWGSFQALRQTRLKMMVAYSTVAQIGYLFMAYPLAAVAGVQTWWAAVYLLMSHGLAKTAMFMAAGNLVRFGGHDNIASLDRAVQRLPVTVAAFGLAGVSIMGLPPSGGFIGKWLLLQAAISHHRWDMVVLFIVGGLLAAAYIFKVLGHAFTQASNPHESHRVPVSMEWAALMLALGAIALGFLSPVLSPLGGIGGAIMLEGGGS